MYLNWLFFPFFCNVRLSLLRKYCKILPTYRQERLALSKGRKEVTKMSNSDLILYFVNKYITEREKNIILQQQLQHTKQISDEKKVKANE